MAGQGRVVLEMKGITKRFPGVLALDRVDFNVRAGEVHLLMGENGAGKSTLMKVLSGAYPKDAGEIRINGKTAEIRSPHHARQLGVAMIYQEMTLVPHLSVAENIFLGREPSRWGFISRAQMRKEASRLLHRLRAGFSPDAPVSGLPVAKQQIVEIARALSLNARILVMDEPTAPLSQKEVSSLFRIIRALRSSGAAIVYISHRLEEARQVGDRVTVLRDGKLAGTGPLGRLSDGALVRLMVGRALSRQFPRLPAAGRGTLLKAEGLARRGAFGPISFSLARGEILGLAGLVGAGRTELARCLAGADRPTAGSIALDGTRRTFRSPGEAKRAGIALLPEDRKAQGLVLGLPLLHNASLAALDKFTRFGFIRRGREEKVVSGLVRKLDIRPPDLDRVTRYLSGGNQQKVVLAKWLAVSPRIIIFDEPTRGIDVRAKFEVYRLITSLAAAGAGIIFISSDLGEVLGLSHRVAVMRTGRITSVLPRKSATPERVMHLAMGLNPGR